MIALILMKVYLKLFDSYTMLGIDNSKINCNKEHKECVATVMFGYTMLGVTRNTCSVWQLPYLAISILIL